jgi:hypothetical protein
VITQDGRRVYPVYHPAAALRSTGLAKVLREDFARIPALLASSERPKAVAMDAPVVDEPEDPATQLSLL